MKFLLLIWKHTEGGGVSITLPFAIKTFLKNRVVKSTHHRRPVIRHSRDPSVVVDAVLREHHGWGEYLIPYRGTFAFFTTSMRG